MIKIQPIVVNTVHITAHNVSAIVLG